MQKNMQNMNPPPIGICKKISNMKKMQNIAFSHPAWALRPGRVWGQKKYDKYAKYAEYAE